MNVNLLVVWMIVTETKGPWTVQSTLHFTPWLTCLFHHHLDFSGKLSAMLQLLYKDCSFRCPPLSVAKYLFIGMKKNYEIVKALKWQQEDSNSGSLN